MKKQNSAITRDRLEQIIAQMQKKKLLVVGDLMFDQFIYGSVSRISPEAPVPVVQVTKEVSFPGGAANVGRNLADFQIPCELCGLVGNDRDGDRLLSLIEEEHIGIKGILREDDYVTTRKTRIIARNQQVVRVDREVPYTISLFHLAKLRSFLEKEIAEVDAVIIEDYGKGFITQALVKELVEIAKKYKKIITVDPNSYNPLDWEGVTVVKPNRAEAFTVLNIPPQTGRGMMRQIGEQLLARWKVPHVLLTMGEDGMLLFEVGKEPYHIPTCAREVFDVSGAGDTAIAFFTATMASGCPASEAAEVANLAAGVVVGKLGTATITPQELLDAVNP